MDSGTKFTSLICPPSFVGGSLIFLLEESYRSELKVSCLQKFAQKQVSHKVPTWVHYFSLSMSMTCQIQVTTKTNKSRFVDDAGQWTVSKNIDLAAKYPQRVLDKMARWCAKWRIKLNPEKIKVMIFSKSRSAIKGEPALSLYGDLLSYYPHIKFLSHLTIAWL